VWKLGPAHLSPTLLLQVEHPFAHSVDACCRFRIEMETGIVSRVVLYSVLNSDGFAMDKTKVGTGNRPRKRYAIHELSFAFEKRA